MECKDVRNKLPAYLEGAITPEQKNLVEEHLLSCLPCGDALEDLKKAGELVRGLNAVEPPPWMTQKVMARIRAEEEKKRIVRKLFFPLHVKIPIQAFATVLIVIAAIYVFKSVEPEMKEVIRTPSLPESPIVTTEPMNQPADVKERSAEVDKADTVQRRGERGDVSSVGEQAAVGETKMADETKKKEAVETPRETFESQQSPVRQQPPAPVAGIQKDEAAGVMKARRALSAAAPRSKASQMFVEIQVRSVSDAIGQVEKLLSDMGALNVEKESLPDVDVVTTDFRTEKIQELLESLKQIGDVREGSPPLEMAGREVRIRIEIIHKN